MYRTIYQGRHTCTNGHQLESSPEITFGDGSDVPGSNGTSIVLNFGNNDTIGCPIGASSKNEERNVMPASSNDDYYLSMFGSKTGIPAPSSSGHGGVMSNSHDGFHIDMGMGFDDLNDILFK